ncbi:MAG: hypothetical protein L0Y50_03175 [Beijerinckiaceae bacterium]|nr:hypothetical protein [Beijerinckiaceae bacterium]
MTPQSSFFVIAPVPRDRVEELRAFLLTMNTTDVPGFADPENKLVPFGKFKTVHFGRFLILKDDTLDDLEPFGAQFPDAPIYLAFLVSCDGSADALLAGFANIAGDGLRQIFAFCEGFDPKCNLLQWMRAHLVRPRATYFNFIGRTVLQIHEEAALHEALRTHLSGLSVGAPPRQIRDALVSAVREKGVKLTEPAPTPILWFLCHRLPYHLAAVLGVFLVLAPVLTLSFGAALKVYGAALFVIAVALCVFIVRLRRHETRDPEILTPVTSKHLQDLGSIEDYDPTNQYSILGSLRPGAFPLRTTAVLWWLLKVAPPILFPSGNLARIMTIHSAHFYFLDGGRRGYFATNYDGSDEAYMDDFVNKVAFGLNFSFALWAPYPRTRFLLWDGANDEQKFKAQQTRHSLPTEVWHKAYPGLSLYDISRNTRIRQGFERKDMSDTEIRQWLSEI